MKKRYYVESSDEHVRYRDRAWLVMDRGRKCCDEACPVRVAEFESRIQAREYAREANASLGDES
jgi:hypothetical protein